MKNKVCIRVDMDKSIAPAIISTLKACAGVEVQIIEQTPINREILGEAIKAVQYMFWGQSSYAVIFCSLRDNFDYGDNGTQFEEDIMALSNQIKFDFLCPPNTIASSFYYNSYMKMHVDKWASLSVKTRCLKLVEAFKNEVNRILEKEKF